MIAAAALLLACVLTSQGVGAQSTQQPSAFDKQCFGCIMNNYKYCGAKKTCVKISESCDQKESNMEYIREKGCPIEKKCNLGINGNFYIDTGNAASGGLDTSLDNSIRLSDLTLSRVKDNPSNFPCALVLYNIPKKELNFQISGPNVGVQLLKLNYPNGVEKIHLNPYNAYSSFTLLP